MRGTHRIGIVIGLSVAGLVVIALVVWVVRSQPRRLDTTVSPGQGDALDRTGEIEGEPRGGPLAEEGRDDGSHRAHAGAPDEPGAVLNENAQASEPSAAPSENAGGPDEPEAVPSENVDEAATEAVHGDGLKVDVGDADPSIDVESEADPLQPSAPQASPDRSAELKMTAEELLAAANLELDARDYREAYRLATASARKQPTRAASLVRGQAACGMHNKELAKDAMKEFKVADPERKTIRDLCKDNHVKLGI